MIIEEGTVLILEGNYRYLLVHEIGELEGHPNKMYYFGAGVTDDEKINIDDVCFIEIEKDEQGYTAMKVEKNTELYDTLAVLESISAATDIDPTLENKIVDELEKYE